MKTFFYIENSNYDKERGSREPLHINNAGYYFDIEKDILTVRKNGRKDYLLLYVSEGEMRVNGSRLEAGDAYILLPDEPQEYSHKAMKRSRYYWIHFIGNEIGDLLSKYDMQNGVLQNNSRKSEKDNLIGMLMQEMKTCGEAPSDYAMSLLFSFLTLLGMKKSNFPFSRALSELRKTNGAEIAKIAEDYHMSVPHFIRSFKEHYKITPKDYRQNHRILQAMNLLESSNLTIKIISEQCGFHDQFYFSRLFKKRTSLNPSEYRWSKRKI